MSTSNSIEIPKTTDVLIRLAAERVKLQQRQSELESKTSAELKTVEQYNLSVKDLARQRRILELAREKFRILQASIASRLEYLHEGCWASLDEDVTGQGHPIMIQKWYSVLSGVKAAVEDFPNFEASQVAKIQALEAQVAAFAVEHKINAQ